MRFDVDVSARVEHVSLTIKPIAVSHQLRCVWSRWRWEGGRGQLPQWMVGATNTWAGERGRFACVRCPEPLSCGAVALLADVTAIVSGSRRGNLELRIEREGRQPVCDVGRSTNWGKEGRSRRTQREPLPRRETPCHASPSPRRGSCRRHRTAEATTPCDSPSCVGAVRGCVRGSLHGSSHPQLPRILRVHAPRRHPSARHAPWRETPPARLPVSQTPHCPYRFVEEEDMASAQPRLVAQPSTGYTGHLHDRAILGGQFRRWKRWKPEMPRRPAPPLVPPEESKGGDNAGAAGCNAEQETHLPASSGVQVKPAAAAKAAAKHDEAAARCRLLDRAGSGWMHGFRAAQAAAASPPGVCSMCTFANCPSSTRCGICGTPMTPSAPRGKEESKCDKEAQEGGTVCTRCTYMNATGATRCKMCAGPTGTGSGDGGFDSDGSSMPSLCSASDDDDETFDERHELARCIHQDSAASPSGARHGFYHADSPLEAKAVQITHGPPSDECWRRSSSSRRLFADHSAPVLPELTAVGRSDFQLSAELFTLYHPASMGKEAGGGASRSAGAVDPAVMEFLRRTNVRMAQAVRLYTYTGCTIAAAKHYLEMCGGEIDRAVELFCKLRQLDTQDGFHSAAEEAKVGGLGEAEEVD